MELDSVNTYLISVKAGGHPLYALLCGSLLSRNGRIDLIIDVVLLKSTTS